MRQDGGNNSTYSERANINPGAANANCHKTTMNHTIYNYFCSDATAGSTDMTFTQPAWGYYGDSSRDALRAPGTINADLSLSKSFSIVERGALSCGSTHSMPSTIGIQDNLTTR